MRHICGYEKNDHKMRTKYNEFLSSHSLVIKYVHHFLEVGLGWIAVRLGCIRLAHAQMIINSSVINIPPHDFKQPSCWCY
jgi:hypothetical protein